MQMLRLNTACFHISQGMSPSELARIAGASRSWPQFSLPITSLYFSKRRSVTLRTPEVITHSCLRSGLKHFERPLVLMWHDAMHKADSLCYVFRVQTSVKSGDAAEASDARHTLRRWTTCLVMNQLLVIVYSETFFWFVCVCVFTHMHAPYSVTWSWTVKVTVQGVRC